MYIPPKICFQLCMCIKYTFVCHYSRYHLIIERDYMCWQISYFPPYHMLWPYTLYIFTRINVHIIKFGLISENTIIVVCYTVIYPDNKSQLEINFRSSHNDCKTADSWGSESMSWAKGWRSLYGRISWSTSCYVVCKTTCSEICISKMESLVILLLPRPP